MSKNDDAFEALTHQFELHPPSDVISVSVLNDFELIERLNEIVEELLQRKEALSQRTQTGRDLQSWRTACLVEMTRRGLR